MLVKVKIIQYNWIIFANMNNNLQNLSGVIDKFVLQSRLKNYRNLNDKVSRLLSAGELKQLKRGLYITKESIEKGEYSEYQLANIMYGPSYVSLFSALSYYGIIPERVVDIESVVTLKSKKLRVDNLTYLYKKLPAKTFHLGIEQISYGKISYLMATPTKALIDVLWTEKLLGIYGVKTLSAYLQENLRIDEEYIANLDSELISKCMIYGRRKKKLSLLLSLVEQLKGEL